MVGTRAGSGCRHPTAGWAVLEGRGGGGGLLNLNWEVVGGLFNLNWEIWEFNLNWEIVGGGGMFDLNRGRGGAFKLNGQIVGAHFI